MRRIPDATADSLQAFIHEAVAPGSVLHTDGFLSYDRLEKHGYRHLITFLKGRQESASKLLPRVHRGCGSRAHLDYYLDEFTFRFNRRTSRHRGKLFYRLTQQGVAVDPAPYASLVKHVRSGKRRRRRHKILGVTFLIAEVGTDMSRFPTVGHLISWAGLCPRLDESAGKRRSTRTRRSAPWLKTTLVNAAWAATPKKDSYLRAQFLRIKSRRGAKKAILAVASSMLSAAYVICETASSITISVIATSCNATRSRSPSASCSVFTTSASWSR